MKPRKSNQQAFEEMIERESLRFNGVRQFTMDTDEDAIVENFVKSTMTKKIAEILSETNEPEREIFLMYSEGLNQRQIGKLTNRSQVFVSRSIKKTKRKLLFFLKNDSM